MRCGWEGRNLLSRNIAAVARTEQSVQVNKYTMYLYTIEWCFILWMPIDQAGCLADKGTYLCVAGRVKRHKESGQ